MAWDQLEPTPSHLSFLVLSAFLIVYSLFSSFLRNRLHLSEPPFAVLVGIILGPGALGILSPIVWGLNDNFTQEFTRLVLSVQCFSVGVELPQHFLSSKWRSLALLLGPVMTAGWLICAGLLCLIFHTTFPTALIISACLTPTDPVLAASILANSQFSERVPRRVRNLLSAESGCNDGTSFPFLYIGLAVLMGSSADDMLKRWFLTTILWQCVLGIIVGCIIGHCAYRALRYCDARDWIVTESFLVFYLLLAVFCVGVASTLGLDDFLVAFSAGVTFARSGWFAERTSKSKLPDVIDLQLNSGVFIYFGSRMPWDTFTNGLDGNMPYLTLGRLFLFFALVLLLRRIPVILALKPLIPEIRTWTEAMFAGHFGPMGVGALFLAIEARAQLETDTSLPLPSPPHDLPDTRQRAVDLLWPVVCFTVLGSTMVHGLSALVLSAVGRFRQKADERTPLLGNERRTLDGMESD